MSGDSPVDETTRDSEPGEDSEAPEGGPTHWVSTTSGLDLDDYAWVVDTAVRHARRVVVSVVGGTVLLVGIALLVLPGPAMLVIPAGLAILALEFAWARRWLRIVRERAQQAIDAAIGAEEAANEPDDGEAPR